MSFNKKVYEAVSKIPKGKVATYGQIAAICGEPRASRAVGRALHHNPSPVIVPCHRVVNRHGYLSGAFAFGGIEAQKALLESEGVIVSYGYIVDLDIFLWKS